MAEKKNPNSGKQTMGAGIAPWFRGEIRKWQKKEIITANQQRQIESLYIWPETKPEKKTESNTIEKNPLNPVHVLGVIGAVLVGIGIISFIGFNWTAMSKGVKVGILFAILFSVETAGYYLFSSNERLQKAGEHLLLLGAICFGGLIWQVGQIYHIQASFPMGVFAWALGALPLVLLTRSAKIAGFIHGLYFLWVVLVASDFRSFQLLSFASFTAIALFLGYYLRSFRLLCSALFTLSLYMIVVCVHWSGTIVAHLLLLPIVAFGFFLFGLGQFHLKSENPFQTFGKMVDTFGKTVIFSLVLMYPVLGPLIQWTGGGSPFQQPLYLIMVGTYLVGGSGLFLLSGKRDGEVKKLRIFTLLATLINGFLFLIPRFSGTILPYWIPAVFLFVCYYFVYRKTGLLGYLPFYLGFLLLCTAGVGNNSLWLLPAFGFLGMLFYYWRLFPDGDNMDLSVGYPVLGLGLVFFTLFGLHWIRESSSDSWFVQLPRVGPEPVIILVLLAAAAVIMGCISFSRDRKARLLQVSWLTVVDHFSFILFMGIGVIYAFADAVPTLLRLVFYPTIICYLYRLFYKAYLGKERGIQVVCLLSIVLFLLFHYTAVPSATVFSLLIMSSLLIFAGEVVGTQKKPLLPAAGLSQTGLFLFLSFLFVFTFTGLPVSLLGSVQGATVQSGSMGSLSIGAGLVLLSLPVVFLFWRARSISGILPEERFRDLLIFLIPAAIFVLFVLQTGGLLFVAVVNILFLLLLMMIIFVGYRRNDSFSKRTGLVFLILELAVRFFEMELSQSIKALLFTGVGIVVIVVSVLLEKNKDRIVIGHEK